MWIRLLKGYTHKDKKKFPVGQILNVGRKTYKYLMDKKMAEDYNDSVPPKKKAKTEFFKQK